MSLQLSLVLACGVIALFYGGWLVQQLLALSPGTKEMQEIAAAIQRYVALLEKYCRSDPYNWFNFFDFWHGDRKSVV